ncbi:MAG: rhodanese-like domain-containing protein [Isosphaerales bacterium]
MLSEAELTAFHGYDRLNGRFRTVSLTHHELDRPFAGRIQSWILLILASGWARAGDGERKEAGPYCGLYCAYGALQAIGKDVPFETLLRPRYMSSRQGSSVKELRQAVIDAGAHAVALAGLGAESLRTARHPMILHVATDGQLRQYDHWVLFCGMQDGRARLLDAPNPMEFVPLSDILARWNGTALVVSDEPSDFSSIAVGEVASYVSVILSTLLIICLADYGLRRLKSIRAGEVAHPAQSRVAVALSQAVALTCCSLVLVIGLHAIDDVGFLQNPSAARYVAAANISRFFPKLTYDGARRFLNERRGTVVDARFPAAFESGHIAGAINVPVNASSAERHERLRGIPRQTPLLVYCQSSRCEYDEHVATLVARDGFESIALYPGGWKEWEEHERANRVEH